MTSQIFSKAKGAPGPTQPEIYVGAFGKHPAWNDFIDDPGIDTERLIGVKRVMFLEGIGAAVETGAWDKLEPAQKVDGFGHLVIWRSRGEIVVVRLWSSSDGKGRTKYPMAVVAQCRGVSLAWVLVETLPRLERLERRCREATTQEQVRAALDATRQELRGRAAVSEGGTPIQPEAVAEVADELSAAGSREPYYRLMYQIERDWGAYLTRRSDSASATRSSAAGIRPQHARVPSGAGTMEEGIRRWMHFILNLVDNATSITLIRGTDAAPEAAGWTDLIVGEPEGSQFFCMRASEQSLPLATSVPYTIDADFRSKCDRGVEEAKNGQHAGQAPEVVTASASGLLDRVKGLLGGKRKSLLVLLIAAGLVGTGVGIAVYFSGGGGARGGGNDGRARAEGDRSGADAPREHPPPSNPGEGNEVAGGDATDVSDGEKEWERLCVAYHEWFAEFLQRLQKKPSIEAGAGAAAYQSRVEYYSTDPHLRDLLERLSEVQAVRPVDPWAIAGVAKSRDLADLARDPPAAILLPDVQAHIARVRAIVEGFSTNLGTQWPALTVLVDAAADLSAAGRDGEAAFLRELVSRVGAGGAPVSGVQAERIDAVLGAKEVVDEVRRLQSVRDACEALAEGTNDPMLSRFKEWAAAVGAPARGEASDLASLEDLARGLGRVAEVAEPLTRFLREDWGRTDAALVSRRVAADPSIDVAKPDRNAFLRWLAVAKASPTLDPGLDPRRTSELEGLISAARRARERLRSEFQANPDLRLEELHASVEATWGQLRETSFDAESRERVGEGVARLEAQVRELRQGLENAVAIEAARRAGSAREVREGLAAQETIVARSEVLNAAWRAGRDALLRSTPEDAYAELRVEADGLRRALTGLDEEMPTAFAAARGDSIARALAAHSREVREDAIRGVVEKWAGIGKDPGGEMLLAEGKDAGRKFGRKVASMESFEADGRVIGVAVAAGGSLHDRTATGEPLASVVERWRRAELMRVEEVAAAAHPLLEEVAALERVESLVGANELATAAEEALPDRWSLALAGWRRLGRLASPAWPDSFGALQREEAISRKLLAATATADVDRRAELESEIREQRRARWNGAFVKLTDPGEIELASALAEEMGVEPSSLTGVSRYNFELAEMRRAARAGVLADDEARKRAEGFERHVQELPADVRDLPSVKRLLGRLQPIATGDKEAAPAIAVTSLGPGAATVALKGFIGEIDGEIVRFRHPGGPAGGVTLEFARVDPEPGAARGRETFFVATTEVSLGQLIAIVELAGAWEELGELFVSTQPDDDFRKGPRVWRWREGGAGGAGIRPAERWLRELATGRRVADYPSGVDPGVPDLGHPVNYIPPGAALFVAHLGGCRLPTVEEWRAAAAKVGALKNLRGSNLRDQQWKAEQSHISGIARSGSVNWPDDDVFVPVGGAGVRVGEEAISHPWDDGVVWFSRVDEAVGGGGKGGAGVGAIHLVGNVAEMVLDVAAGELIAPASGPTGRAAKSLVMRHRTALRVVGGSALSPLEIAPDNAVEMDLDEAAGGYADVGFRLAFSAVGVGPAEEPLGVRLAKAVGEAQYLPQMRPP